MEETDRPAARPAPADQIVRSDADSLRLLVENTVDYAIFLLDPRGCIVSWNVGAERIKGYRADEIIGRHFSVFYTQDAIDRGWPAHELKEAARAGRFEDEGWRVRKDGSRFWANVIITALSGPEGDLRGYAKVTRDITQRKANEERIENLTRELQQRVRELDATNRELAQKTAEVESFVYSVSHDLRAPLVNLQGFSQELDLSGQTLKALLGTPGVPADVAAQGAAVIDGEFTESITFIGNAVRHLGNIIDGLLRLSRVGRIDYEIQPVETAVLVSEILASMHKTVEEAGAQIEVHPLPAVQADRNALGQVFANLVGNALKSFDGRRPGRIEISASGDDPPVFAVRDNGIGIPEEHRSRIFQVFQHVHQDVPHGEGMGLAIVRRIVERHGGRVWFESIAGAGTTFFFTLGRSAASAAAGG